MAKKPKVKKGCIIAIIIVLLIAAGIAFLIHKAKSVLEAAVSVPYGKVEVQDLSQYVNLSGNVSSANSINVTTDLELKVLKLHVKVGDNVKKGDVLCELDATSLQEKYDQTLNSANKSQNAEDYKMGILRRNLNNARSEKTDALNKAQDQINKAIAERDTAYQNYNASVDRHNQMLNDINALQQEAAENPDAAARLEMLQAQADALYEANEATNARLSEYDKAVTAAQDAYTETSKKADELIQSAQDAVDAETYTAIDDDSASTLTKLQEQIDNCIITAPEDGVITQLNISEGSFPKGENLMTIEQTESLVIRGKVSESDILRIEEGMPCEIKATATDNKVINGTLNRIERIVSSDANVSDGYTVEVAIDDNNSNLLIGMSANAKILLDKKENVLSVPYDSVLGSENEGYFVYVLEPAEPNTVKVVRKDIKIGFEGAYYTEVLDCDLKEGDIVATDVSNVMLTEGTVLPDPRLMEGLNPDSSDAS